jgi:pimeloyl-ACP methyl ester carboxylesterase
MAMSKPTELALRAGLRGLPKGSAQYGIGWIYSYIAAARPGRIDPIARSGFSAHYAGRDRFPALFPLARVLLDELRTAHLDALVASASVPVLLVFGSRDLLTPARVLRRLDKPGGAVVLPVCGHCPQVDRPAELLSAVVPFLSGQ